MHPDLVYDVGMNNGDDTAYYLHRGYRVVAIEADPEIAWVAAARFPEAIAEGRLTILNVAIAEREGVLPFYINPAQPGWHSLSEEQTTRDGTPAKVIEVPCITFDRVLDDHGVPFYLKIDIEYADHFCLDALRGRADLPSYLSFEIGPEAAQRMPLLYALGYTQFKFIAQSSFLPIQPQPLPNQAQASLALGLRRFFRTRSLLSRPSYKLGGRRLVEHLYKQFRTDTDGWQFDEKSSGPFGEATVGTWHSYDQMIQIMADAAERIIAGERYGFFDPRALSWIDVHAKRNQAQPADTDEPDDSQPHPGPLSAPMPFVWPNTHAASDSPYAS